MLPTYDMIDLMPKTNIVLVDEAVFAPISSAASLADVTCHARASGELSL